MQALADAAERDDEFWLAALFLRAIALEGVHGHITKAREAIAATKATDSFDTILIRASGQLKNLLTANSPDQAARISIVVDEEAIALAARRGDLELEAARIFAAAFSDSSFFCSPQLLQGARCSAGPGCRPSTCGQSPNRNQNTHCN